MAKEVTKTATPNRASLLQKFAARYSVEPDKLLASLKQTAFHSSKEVTDAQMLALLVIADQYGLNVFTRELFAFPDDKKGGIVPVVSVDGWTRIINGHKQLAAIEFEYAPDDSDDPWIACTITRKDRQKPLTVREYLSECRRETGPWKSHPRRMLRHKSLIQAARIAFGFAGIYDPDEAERIANATAIDGTFKDVTGKPAIAGKVAREKPAHYDEWLDNLRPVADDGNEALEAMFANAPADMRAYLTVEDSKVWEALRAKAAAQTIP